MTDVDAVFDEVTRSILGGGKLAALRRALLETAGLPGDVAELGVYRGGAARLLALTAPTSTLHLFDTFAGIPEDDAAEGGAHERGEFACDSAAVAAFVRSGLAVYHVGAFPGTAVDGLRFRFAHVDGDTYQTTRAALEYFVPRLVPGGVIVFDDCDWPKCPGVRRAIDEAGIVVEKPTHHQGIYRAPGGANGIMSATRLTGFPPAIRSD